MGVSVSDYRSACAILVAIPAAALLVLLSWLLSQALRLTLH
jgi:hypothetical protein